MKLNKILFFSMIILIAGCGLAPSEQIMAPLQYQETVSTHINQNAVLNWQFEKQITTSEQRRQYSSFLDASFDNSARDRAPGAYTYTYGKAHQAVFMTSFKDILEKHQVFNSVELNADPDKIVKNAVSLTVDFKHTRVATPEQGYQIVLDVDFTIRAPGKPTLKKSYLVQSDTGGFWTGKTFKEQQTDVSLKLVKKLLAAIREWQLQFSRG